MNPLRIGVREAKINLSRLLKMVQQNHEVILTHRGRPVGRLVPMGAESLSLDERIKRFEDMGLIEGRSPRTRKDLPAPLPVPGECAQKFLREDREDAAR
jgi:prevent-host-death family protein